MPIFPIGGRAVHLVPLAWVLGFVASCDVYTSDLVTGNGYQSVGGTVFDSLSGSNGNLNTGGTSSAGGTACSDGTTFSGGTIATNSSSTGGGTVGLGSSATTLPGVSFDCSTVDALLVDDMEDQDGYIYPCNGRQGKWLTFVSANDWDANLVPKPNAPFVMTSVSRTNINQTVSSYAAAVSGDTTKNGDCGMEVLLNTTSNVKSVIDLSSYGSVQFWYKTEGLPVGSNSALLRVQLLLQTTLAVADGGVCSAGTVGAECNDHYSFVLPPACDWTEAKIQLNSSSFTQSSTWGLDVLFDLTRVMGVQFVVKQGHDAPFKVTVDDLVLAK